MYAGSSYKGQTTTIVSDGTSDLAKTTFTLNAGSWTVSELSNARLYISATNGARNTARYLYVYGATIAVTISGDSTTYIYTISNISGDHTVVITDAGGKSYVKSGNSWVELQGIWKKVSDTWVKQTDLSNIFVSNKIYIHNEQ